MVRSSGILLQDLRRRLAAMLLGVIVVQTLLRLGLLVPVYAMGRSSPIIHAVTMILVAGGATWGLLAAKGRKVPQLLVALMLGAVFLILTAYDIDAIMTARLHSRALTLQAAARFYCDDTGWAACMSGYPRVIGATAAVFAVWSAVFFCCADALADRIGPAVRWLDQACRSRLRLGVRALLIGLGGIYLLAWLALPSQLAKREPLAYLFQTNYYTFLVGPTELKDRLRSGIPISPTANIRPRTLVLIVIDSLRSDSVGLRPGQPTLTPFLRSLAQSGHLHDIGPASAICTTSYCGIVALQSSGSWAVQQHGPPVMLADALAANGFQSHFLLSGPHLGYANLGRIYGPNVTTLLDDSSPDSSGLADDRDVVRRLARLPIKTPERSYVSIHLMSAHAAGKRFFKLDAPGASADWSRDYRPFYSAGVVQADEIVRQLFAQLKRKGLLDNALVIITADHGDRLDIRPGMEAHGGDPEPATVSIPLLVYDSRSSAWCGRALASQIDVAPTMLDAVGIGIPDSWVGESLVLPATRVAVPVDSYDTAGMAAVVAGRKLLFRCKVRAGETSVVSFDGPALTPGERARALALAPGLYATLASRRDGGQCFATASADGARH